MLRDQRQFKIKDLEFTVVYSRRRTIGISVHTDATVVVRAPYLTSQKTIARIINEKYEWVLKHRNNYRNNNKSTIKHTYTTGEVQLFHGKNLNLEVEYSVKTYVCFSDSTILIGTGKNDSLSVKRLLYTAYKNEALKYFPGILDKVLMKHETYAFKPTGLIVRTMKRRWGSCSNKGIITLSTELIKLSDIYIEYVILHELCHLRHHNHGPKFYELLSEVFPDWKSVRKELRKHIQ